VVVGILYLELVVIVRAEVLVVGKRKTKNTLVSYILAQDN
jgi:hypothetical protein